MNTIFCQSCGMPLENQDILGTNADGSKNSEYCSYCFKNGEFTSDCTMEEMIDFCVGPMIEANPEMKAEKAAEMMRQFFPTLKRWSKA